MGHVVAGRRRLREQRQRRSDQDEAGEQRGPGTEAHDERAGVAQRQDAHGERGRQEREPDLQRVVAEHALQVERAEEEHPEHPRHGQGLDEVRARDVARAEDAQRDQRAACGRLADEERGQQRERDGPEDERATGAPALVGGGLDDRVDAEHQRARDQDGSGDVGSAAEADPLVPVEQARRERRRGDADRDVHEEDPVPVERLRQHAAREQAHRAPGRRDEAVDADRLRAVARLGEHRHDDAEDHRRRHRAADSLEEPRADEQLLALRDSAQQGGAGEDAEAGEEDRPAPDQVAEPAGQQQEAAEGDQVRVDHPGEAGVREAEIVLNRREGDVHDGRVEDDHQHAHAEDVEGEPA